jgi:hypothetical protein
MCLGFFGLFPEIYGRELVIGFKKIILSNKTPLMTQPQVANYQLLIRYIFFLQKNFVFISDNPFHNSIRR